MQWPPEVVADGIALARLIPAGVDVRGNSTRARIVLFRKPIERRAKDTVELTELLHELLVAQVATYLGVEPSVIDPTLDEDYLRCCAPGLLRMRRASDDAALDASTFPLGQTAPDAEALVVGQRVIEALVPYFAAQADPLGLAR